MFPWSYVAHSGNLGLSPPFFPKKGPMFPCSKTYRGTQVPLSEKGSYVPHCCGGTQDPFLEKGPMFTEIYQSLRQSLSMASRHAFAWPTLASAAQNLNLHSSYFLVTWQFIFLLFKSRITHVCIVPPLIILSCIEAQLFLLLSYLFSIVLCTLVESLKLNVIIQSPLITFHLICLIRSVSDMSAVRNV